MPFGPLPGSRTGPPSGAASRWRAWHKITLGVVGVMALCLCGVAIFAPDPPDQRPVTPSGSPEAAAQQVAAGRSQAVVNGGVKPATAAAPASATSPAPTTTTAKTSTAGSSPRPATPVPASTSAKPRKTTPSPKAVYYANCSAAPGELSSGAPGYRKALDRDGDGTACESSGDDEEPAETEEPTESGTDPRFSTCAKANAAGYGDYVRGTDPEYAWYQDRDKDGVACER